MMGQIVGCRRVRAALSMSDRWHTALATIWLVAMTAAGSATANAPPTAIRDNTLDEILIKAPSLGSLREQMVRLEDEFYRRYNDLKSNDLFDVH